MAHFLASREILSTGETLVAVRGFVPAWRWPNHIGYAGIGHLFADGLVVDERGEIRDAEDDLLWESR